MLTDKYRKSINRLTVIVNQFKVPYLAHLNNIKTMELTTEDMIYVIQSNQLLEKALLNYVFFDSSPENEKRLIELDRTLYKDKFIKENKDMETILNIAKAE